MEKLNLVKITTDSDSTEGRGYEIVIGYVRDMRTADAIVDDKRFSRFCVMGVHSPGQQKWQRAKIELPIYDSPEEFWADHNPEVEARRRALAKLTDEDRRILGLSDE